MRWVKLHTGIHRNPKVRRAGRDARDVFVLLLCINGEHEFQGRIPVDYADPECLAVDLGVTVETARNGVETARNAGLFHVTDDGFVVLSGYSDEWAPKEEKSTERVRAFRERSKAKPQNSSNGTPETQVKPFHETDGTIGTDGTLSEESRVDKKRIDKSVAAPLLDASALEVAVYLLEAIRSHAPNAKGDPKSWAKDIDLAIRVDGRTVEGLKRAIDQAHRSSDPFWRPNLLSGKSLRKQYQRLEIKAAQQTLGQRDVRVGHVAVTGREVYAGGEVKI